MNYQTLLADATNWFISDPSRIGLVIGAFFAIVAVKTVRRELSGKH